MDGPLIFVLELWVPFGVNFFLPKMTRDQPVPNRAMAMVLCLHEVSTIGEDKRHRP